MSLDYPRCLIGSVITVADGVTICMYKGGSLVIYAAKQNTPRPKRLEQMNL